MPTRGTKVVVIDGGYASYDVERTVLAPFDANVLVAPCHGDASRVVAVAADADAVLVRETPLPAGVIDRLGRCRAIVRYGVGVDNIDGARAAARGIHVANVPDYGVDEVSEHALALLLAVKRQVLLRDRNIRAGQWGAPPALPLHRSSTQTLGLVGCGRIGRRFLRKAMALGFAEALVFDHNPPPAPALAVDLETLCERADVISLHLPLSAETHHLFDAERLARLRPGAILVNTARGALVDGEALAEALTAGRMGGAGIDVFESEPIAVDHPLLDAPNCVLSDHFAWSSEEAEGDLQRLAAEEIARVFRGEKPNNWVNPW